MRFTKQMRNSADNIWQKCFDHPFVKGLGDGSLAIEKFKFFMMQDYLYLLEYVKVFALGVVKAEKTEDMQMFSKSVEQTLNGEMDIHRAYMKRLGITDEELIACKRSFANSSYTAYMLSCAFNGGLPEIAVSILACSWSYAEIGKRLFGIPNAAEHPVYGEWIKGYADEEYQKHNDQLIAFTEKLCADCSEERLKKLEKIFIDCSLCEYHFWEMAWNMEE